MEFVGEGTTADDARRLATEKQPDVLIIDIAIPKARAVVAEIVKQGIKCVVLTTLDDVLSVSNALAGGANGYILKGVSGLELISAFEGHLRWRADYVTAEIGARVLIGGYLVPKRVAKVQGALSFQGEEQQLARHIIKGSIPESENSRTKLGLTRWHDQSLPDTTIQENACLVVELQADYCSSKSELFP